MRIFKPQFVKDNNYRFEWGEIDRHWTMPRISINDWHDSHSTLVLGLIYATVYISIPKFPGLDGFGGGAYGWWFSNDALVLEWGKHNKFLYFPWSWDFYKGWELAEGYGNDLVWVEIPRRYMHGKIGKKEKSPYVYKLKSGEIQNRIAEFYISRREWRWRALMCLPWPRMVKTSIEVSFDGEVGEGSGSWKGGTVGCGYEMNPGETGVETLRRMERERIFK